MGFPYVFAKEETVLRYVASGVNAYQQIADKAKQDLGITVKLERATTIQENMLRAITRPKTLDVLDLDYGHVRSLMRMGMLKVLETKKLNISISFQQYSLTELWPTESYPGRAEPHF